jgi:competence protein ComFC
MKLREFFNAAIELVYPRNCLFCQKTVDGDRDGYVCPSCLSAVKWLAPPFCQRCALPYAGAVPETFVCENCRHLKFHFERVVCACRAEGVVREAIHRFKYNREMYFGPYLADWFVQGVRDKLDWADVDAVIPVPLHPRKRRERGFNQAEYLADALKKSVGAEILSGNLRRVKDTATQTALDAKQRAANLRGAFVLREPQAVKGKRAAILDDVFTTGATTNECARVLADAGAASLIVLTLARGL